jgi:hypothetical protein
MYDEIRKPTLLRDIPLLLIRGLSPIYYYCKYANDHAPEAVKNHYINHLSYVASTIQLVGGILKDKNLCELSNSFRQLENLSSGDRLKKLEQLTTKLSAISAKLKSDFEKVVKEKKSELVEVYNQSIDKLKLLLVDNNNEPDRVKKLQGILGNFCLYEVDSVNIRAHHYPEKLINNDFIFFSSTHPSTIHQTVKSLKTYQKPGLAVAYIDRDGVVDRQAIRHGSQLQKAGFPVLFKVFTPIRLFTSVDKLYMKFHLQN